jgi:hypothetical protein
VPTTLHCHSDGLIPTWLLLLRKFSCECPCSSREHRIMGAEPTLHLGFYRRLLVLLPSSSFKLPSSIPATPKISSHKNSLDGLFSFTTLPASQFLKLMSYSGPPARSRLDTVFQWPLNVFVPHSSVAFSIYILIYREAQSVNCILQTEHKNPSWTDYCQRLGKTA